MEGSQALLAAHGGVISHRDYSDVYTLQMEMSTLRFLIIRDMGHNYQLCAVLWDFKTSFNFASKLRVALKACFSSPRHFHIIMLQWKVLVSGSGVDHIYPGFISFAL